MKRMSVAEIRQLSQSLPDPDASVSLAGARFDIYTAKHFFSRTWEHPALHRLVREARRTYLCYGDIPLVDAYDKKAMVYLIRASYELSAAKGERVPVEEWLSIRFIPAHGLPASTEDMEQYVYRDNTIRHWIQKKFFLDDDEALDHIVTMSRICGISPSYARLEDEKHLALALDPKHRYTAVAFALFNQAFLHACGKQKLPYQYLTCVIRTEFMRKALTMKRGSLRAGFAFSPAYRLLKCPRKRDVRLNRSMLAYQYPGYYLDMPQLLELLQHLVRSGKISDETIQQYTQSTKTLKQLVDEKHSSYLDLVMALRGLGCLLTVEGVLRGSRMTGNDLRKLIDAQVDDGPSLYIMDSTSWKKTIEDFLGTCNEAHI